MKTLLVIDDARIRREAFREAEKLIQKLERLEANLDAFHHEDQRLYSDWFNLTFRKYQDQLDHLHDDLRKLLRFHNWIIAVSQREDISMPAAILKLRTEELRYQTGDESARAEIDEIRRLRDAFILSEVEDEWGASRGDFGIGEDFEKPSYGAAHDSENPEGKPSRTSREEAQFQKLNNFSDKKLRQVCKSFHDAFDLLFQAFELVRNESELTLALRIWEACSKPVQERMAKEFRNQFGSSLSAAMDQVRETVSSAEQEKHEENDFTEEFVGRPKTRENKSKAPELIELAKLCYRKLVRALHPDLQAHSEGDQQSGWQKKTWLQVQMAYKSLDLRALEKLTILVQIRERRLNDLRVSEIRKSADFLTAEIRELESEVRGLKSLPAWGFSRKKNTTSLEREISREFDAQRADLQEEIDDFTRQHEYLVILGEADERIERRSSGKKKTRRSRKRRPRSSIDQQQSFF